MMVLVNTYLAFLELLHALLPHRRLIEHILKSSLQGRYTIIKLKCSPNDFILYIYLLTMCGTAAPAIPTYTKTTGINEHISHYTCIPRTYSSIIATTPRSCISDTMVLFYGSLYTPHSRTPSTITSRAFLAHITYTLPSIT